MTNSLSTIPINRLNSNELNEKINISIEEKANIDLSNTSFANLENVDGTLTWDGNALLKSGDIDTSSYANTNASNFNATGKSTIVGWGIPDYSAGITMSANTNFTCPTIGVVSGELSAANHGYCNVIINNVLVQQVGSENEQRCRGPFYAQVKQGDVVHLLTAGNGNITLCKFYPLKGAN